MSSRRTCDHHERDYQGREFEARTSGSGEGPQQQGGEKQWGHGVAAGLRGQQQQQHVGQRESETVSLPHQTDSLQPTDRWQEADGWEEVVLLLDLLSLPPCLYAPPLRAMLRAPHTLKLGFAFSDDLEFLHQSLPYTTTPFPHTTTPTLLTTKHEHPSQGQDCFHHVAPFIDIGTAYHAIRRTRLHLKRDNLLSLLTAAAPPGSLAARSVLPPASGLSALAQVLLGAPLDKELQCSDWEQRPLSRHQLHYAAADALCLIHMALALLPLAPRPHALSAHALSPHALSAHALSANGKDQLIEEHSHSLSLCHITGKVRSVGKSTDGINNTTSTSSGSDSSASSGQGRAGKGDARAGRPHNGLVSPYHAVRPSDMHGNGLVPPWDVSRGGDGQARFLCDSMVEGLARQLRCVGVDTASPKSLGRDTCDTRKLIEWAEREGRVLLTRDVKLFRRRLLPPTHMHLIRSTDKREQLREVVTAFRLLLCESSLLSRCIRCNGTFKPQALGPSEAAAAAPWTQVVPSHVLDRVAEFWQCCQCQHLYWEVVPCLVLARVVEFWQCCQCQHLYWEGCQFDRAIKQFTEVCQLSAALAQTNVSASS
ncbi:unnamed protein product [Closterium sp. NIES-64]|nr:unnamed protein product [Closterium sp. NIES-64]